MNELGPIGDIIAQHGPWAGACVFLGWLLMKAYQRIDKLQDRNLEVAEKAIKANSEMATALTLMREALK